MPWAIVIFKQIVGDRPHDACSLGEGIEGIGGGGQAHIVAIFEKRFPNLNLLIVTFSP